MAHAWAPPARIRKAKVWDAASGRELHTLSGHTDRVYGVLTFSPDGTRLATASEDGMAKVWDTKTGHELLTLSSHNNEVLGIAFSPDGTRLATASWDKTARVWDTASGRELSPCPATTLGSMALPSAPMAHAWPLPVPVERRRCGMPKPAMSSTLSGHNNGSYGIAFSPDGTRLATASAIGTAKVWDATTGHEILTLSRHTNWSFRYRLQSRWTRLATASLDRMAKVWDATRAMSCYPLWAYRVRSLALPSVPMEQVWPPLVGDKTARVWDTKAGHGVPSPL